MGLRCLRANLGELRQHSVIREFTINDAPSAIIEQLVAEQPKIVALSVYIWNLRQTEVVVGQLKALLPEVVVMIGGPEVSFGTDHTRLADLVDCVVTGRGTRSLRSFVSRCWPARKSRNGHRAEAKCEVDCHALWRVFR